MRWRAAALIAGALALAHITGAAASSYGGNCVLYARSVTGVALDGNAGAWWSRAEGRYARGHEPSTGAVLVFRPSGHMRVGHVAVVSRVVSKREILVDQANWVRGRVVTGMSVVDASPNNDWTSVRVIELGSRTHGRENPTYGFIYPHPPGRPDVEDRIIATAQGAAKAPRPDTSVRLAVAELASPNLKLAAAPAAIGGAVANPPAVKPELGKPAVASPPAQPVLVKPAVVSPPAAQPLLEKPAAVKPPVGRSAVAEPASAKPPVGKTTVDKPPVGKAAASKPAIGKPAVVEPAAAKPPAGKLAADKPAAGKPAIVKAAATAVVAKQAKPARPSDTAGKNVHAAAKKAGAEAGKKRRAAD